ncbi:amino acid adenylation domain-containing protein [Nocardia sp. NPDC052566]|uniref:amino acid adenylation domain-containing protein n=1 Tax=Nocardia sp. NPDC052566 TaxID=3364330 RepID=UPI0037C658B1
MTASDADRRRPLTAAQAGIWFAQQLDTTGRRYVVGGHLHIRGALDTDLFERALRHTVAGSETMRVRFAAEDGAPVQVLEDVRDWVLRRMDFADRPDPLAAAGAFIDAEMDRPYDLTAAPLFDHALLRVGPADHLWFIRFHHIICDGGAMAAFMRRVSDAHRALRAGEALPEGVFDRLDALIDEDVRYRSAHRFTADRDFWAGRLAGLPDAAMLAEDGAGGADEFVRHSGHLDPDTWKALRHRADAYGVRWPVLVLAATAIALQADNGGRVVVPGLTVPAKRSWHALGMTANVVPLRLTVDPAAPLSALVDAVGAESMTVLRHQRYRLADMHRDLGALDSGRRLVGPVVTIMPMETMREFGGHPAVPHEGSPGRTDGVTIGVYDNGEPELRIDIDSVAARHTAANLAAQHARLRAVLAAIAHAEPDTPIGRLRYDADVSAIPAVPADTDAWQPRTLVEALRHGVRTSGDSAALIHGEDVVTYRELDERSNGLAARLVTRGARPGAFVAVLLPRSIDLIVAMVAIVKSGAAYVPLDPGYPTPRLRMMLDEAAPVLVVTDGTHGGVLAPADPVVSIDEGDSGATVAVEPRPDDPAYVIYTSGSTGTPKGVVVTHDSVTRLLAATRGEFGFGPSDVWTLFHSTAFDFSVWEIWGALRHGATLVIVGEQTTRSPEEFLELLVAHRVTVLNQTPAAFDLLTTTLAARPELGAELALRLVVFGGDKLDARRLAGWFERFGAAGPRLVNMYGITETTVHVTAGELGADSVRYPGSVVGLPIPGRAVRLLDTALRPAPPGLPAEMYVGGESVARGYLGRPGLTAARFVADPAGPPGARVYRSGDLGVWRWRGLEYLGRVDRQLKIRGFRIEPGEVEAALRAVPGVSAAAVRAADLGTGDRRLVAYVVAPGLDASRVRDELATSLPAHLLPSIIEPVAALPLTPNGKLDDAALRALRRAVTMPSRPEGEPAATVYRLFGEVLGIGEFDSAEGFFTLGGDSLLAHRLAVRIRAEFGVALTLRDLFARPSVAELAELIGGANSAAPQPVPAAGPRPPRLPLSFAQHRLWTLYRLDPAAPTYHIPFAVRIRGGLDIEVLSAAAGDVQARHESLRTVFTETDGQVWQTVLDGPPAPLSTVHAGDLTAQLADEVARPFELSSRPPWRLVVFARDSGDHVLLTVLHHIAADEHSMGVLGAELRTAYAARLDGHAPGWAPIPIQYADYTLWQRDTLGSADDPDSPLSAELAHWRNTLRGLPAGLSLPFDRASTALTHRGGTVPLRFDEGTRELIAALAARHGATAFMVLHAAVACLLGRLDGGTDIAVGTVTSGRDAAGLDGLIGFFAETVVLRTDLSGDPGFAAVVERARDADITAFSHQAPFDQVVAALRPERAMGQHPLFQAMVTLRAERDPVLDPAGLRGRPVPLAATHAKFPLLFEFAWGAGSVGGALEYSAELFDRETAVALARALRLLLAAVLADPETPFAGMEFLDADDRARLSVTAEVRSPAARTPSEPVDPAVEQVLRTLVASVLGVDDIGVHDSFFRFGGDSILAIRLVNRARAAGVLITPKDVFERQTVRALARIAAPVAAVPTDPLAGVGQIEPTPIMRALLDNPTPTAGFGQYVIVPAPDGATEVSLRAALQTVVDRHDALRMRVVGAAGRRGLEIGAPGSVAAGPLLRRIETDDPEACLDDERAAARGRLAPEAGVLLQAVWFDARPGLLLLVLHHLAVDGVSWRILLPELAAAHHSAATGAELALPPVVTPLRAWAGALASVIVPEDEIRWWTRLASGTSWLGDRVLDPARDTVSAAEIHTVTLGVAHTEALLTQVPHRFHGTAADILLAALSVAAARSAGRAWDGVLVDVEGHGRDLDADALAGMDVSATVGWFTVIRPVRLDVGVADWDTMVHNGSGLADAAKQVKEMLRSVPGRGIGHGLSQRGAVNAPFGFNYLGRLGGETGALGVRFGSVADPSMAVSHAVEINVAVDETAEGPVLRAEWAWAPGVVDGAEITRLAGDWRAALTAFAVHHTDPGGGHTPSDFPLAELSTTELARLEGEFGELADVLPVTPLQAGLLFHTLYQRATEAREDAYVVQLVLDMEGVLDEERLRAATVALLHRHPHLGSAFVVEGLERIVAVVPEGIEPPWRTVDLTDLDAAARAAATERTLREERRRIDPAAPPPLAFCLIRTEAGRWQLAFTHHHVLLDGWSVANVLREMILLYLGAELPPAPPLRDYLAWRATRDRAAAQAAWAVAVRDCGPTRVSRAGRAGWSEQPEVHEFSLPDALAARLLDRAARAGLTLNTMVNTAWALVLGHVTGSHDVVFGTTVSVRPAELDAERMVGLMINTVPVRVRLRPGSTLGALASGVQAERAALYEHEHLGLDEIEELAGSAELFDTSVVFENYPLQVDDLGADGALRMDMAEVYDRPHYPVALAVVPREGQLTFRLSLRAEQVAWFGAAGEWWDRFRAALAALSDTPQHTVAATDLLTGVERELVLGWSRGPVTESETRSLGVVFEDVAARHPDRIAIRSGATELTYGGLSDEVRRLAGYLAARGVGMGTAVGVTLTRSIDVPVAFLAIVRLGALIVPIDQRFPPAHRRTVLERTGSRLVVDHEMLADAAASDAPADDIDAVVPVDAPACLMYTSGSTGVPKGAAVTHRNILTRVFDRFCAGDGSRAEDERILFHSPHSWDFATYELWLPLLTGRAIEVAPAGDLDAADYARLLRDTGITTASISTGLFDLLTEQIPGDLAGLRRVIGCGAAMPPGAAARLRAAGAEGTVLNGFGPVEATFFAVAHPIPRDYRDDDEMPIGRPIDNTTAVVLDSMLRPVAPMVIGEIYLSGAGLADGYYHAPAATAARFVPNPFGPPGSRMYRTGDLGRWDRGGTMHFHGRIDRQVKVSGFRVEPAEVEAALRRQPGITAAVVSARPGPAGTTLIGYIVARTPVDPDAVRARLIEELPRYMVPSAIVTLDALPLNTTGKVDFAALPAPSSGGVRQARTPRQRILAEIFADALGLPEVAVDDDFFLLGGNSLSAMRLVGRIRAALGHAVTVYDLFEAPTVVGLEQRLGARVAASPVQPRRDRPAVLPLSPAQQRFWAINYLEAHRPDYVIAMAVEFTGDLDVPALRAAVGDVVARHEALRTVLPYTDTGPVQQIVPAESVRIGLRVIDIAPADLDDAIAAELAKGFDLMSELPVRGRLFRVEPERHVLFMMCHHVAVDGESLAILRREIATAYLARLGGTAPEWRGAATQYADYALAHQAVLGDEADPESVLATQAAHWRTTLADLPGELSLPYDRPRAAMTDRTADAVPIVIDAPTHTVLTRTARAGAASVYTVVHAALAATLTEAGAGHDIPIGVAVSGRDTDELDSVIGCLVDLVVVRTDTGTPASGAALIRTVRDGLLTAVDNKDYPFDRLVETLNPPRVPHRHPLVQVAVTYRTEPVAQEAFPGGARYPLPTRTVEFDLLLELTEHVESGTITGELVYPRQLFDRPTIDRLVAAMHTQLAALSAEFAM